MFVFGIRARALKAGLPEILFSGVPAGKTQKIN